MINITSSKQLSLLLLIALSSLNLIRGASIRGAGLINDLNQYGNDAVSGDAFDDDENDATQFENDNDYYNFEDISSSMDDEAEYLDSNQEENEGDYGEEFMAAAAFGSPITQTGFLEKNEKYKKFSLHTGTALHETASNFQFLLAPNRDVYVIKKSQTGTKSTEVHVLSKASGYKRFSLHTGTALHETASNFQFLLAPNLDLYVIKKSQTGTRSTEVHVLSNASGYKKFSLQTGTALHETSDNFEFLLAPNLDLYAIKKSQTGTRSTEVHVLSKASGYKRFSLHTGTALHETASNFQFLLAPNLDLYAIKKTQTGTKSTEVHVLSKASGYKEFSLHTGTVLHETGSNFEFLLAPNLDLYAIKKTQTGTKSTEVHVLSK